MTPPLLYSVNPWIKLHIGDVYRGGEHYVWCCEAFDSSSSHSIRRAVLQPPSSNPAEIYRRAKADCRDGDQHSTYIRDHRNTLLGLATRWQTEGAITPGQYEEIMYWLRKAGFDHWRPLLFVIPRAIVEDRLELVPPDRRAGLAPEYTIDGLWRSEFDVLEFRE